ncbi:MAG: hypothetical protein J6S14_08885 [Clostridia bacterium]|nr:hypothetical protein [Clostridia bacterium]
MAEYKRHTWVNGEVITEEKMNNVEQGIAEAMQKGEGNDIIKKAIESHIKDKENPHGVTKEQLGLEKVDNVGVNDMAPTYGDITALSTLVSGEKLNAAFPKIKLAITKLIEHMTNEKNPHKVKLSDLGITRTAEELNAGGLPAVTEADNGKFMRVVNGTWAVASMASAEGSKF